MQKITIIGTTSWGITLGILLGQKGIETPGNAWRDKLKIYDEIDKSLEVVDDNLKTKKLKEGTDET